MQGGFHVVIADNYDSFTFNLAQGFQALGARVTVVRNDAIDIAGLDALAPERLVVSPGPGGPAGSGISEAALRRYRGIIPVLGVCLGHQVLAASFGGAVRPAARPVHGKRSWIHHDGSGIFRDVPNPFIAARYHSLIARAETMPRELLVTAWTDDGEVMGLGVPGEATWGVQFHPESFMTPAGPRIMDAFLRGAVCRTAEPAASVARCRGESRV